MKRKGKESKLNVVLTSALVVFVCLLSFSIGVISGKGWSDREYKVRHIENDSHVKAAMNDNAPIGDEMTEKEVELLTKKALEEAQAEKAEPVQPEPMAMPEPTEAASAEPMMSDKKMDKMAAKLDKKARKLASKKKSKKRKPSSVPTKTSTPKPTSIAYTVQVASYKMKNDAEAHSQRLIDKGFPAFPVPTMIKGEEWYRVSIGSFKNKKQATKYHRSLLKQAVVKDSFVTKIKRLKK